MVKVVLGSLFDDVGLPRTAIQTANAVVASNLIVLSGSNASGVDYSYKFEGSFTFDQFDRTDWTEWSGQITRLTIGDITSTLFPGAPNAMVVTDLGIGIQTLIGSNLVQGLSPNAILRGKDTITGTDARDRIDAARGNDTVLGGGGNDTLLGSTGDDRLLGQNGADTLFGGAGVDRLFGGAGNDGLTGSAGRDILDGGAGRDTLAGGEGRDIFVFHAGGPTDAVRDFENGIDRFRVADFDPDNFSLRVIHDGSDATVDMNGITFVLRDVERGEVGIEDFMIL